MKNPAGHLNILVAALAAAVLLSDCGGGGYDGGGGSTTYTVGGRVEGLSASTLVTLRNNSNSDSVVVSANGSFAFPMGLAYQAAYNLAVQTQPTGRTCVVINGTGNIPLTNVTDVTVACTSDTNAPAVGNLVVTEVMANPVGTDIPQEWFEVLNQTGGALDLGGVVVTSGTGLFVIPAGTSIPSLAFFVFAGNASSAANGGLPAVDVNYGSALQLANTNFDVTLKAATTIVDTIFFATMPTDASFALKQSASDATSNDDSSNWCTSTTTYGAGGKGTPRASNSDCP